jgi:hypothetical protein
LANGWPVFIRYFLPRQGFLLRKKTDASVSY